MTPDQPIGRCLKRMDETVRTYLSTTGEEGIPQKVRLHDLRHMVFWHDYYRCVVGKLVAGNAPNVLRGTYKVINRDAQRLYPGADANALRAEIEASHLALLADLPKLPAGQMVPYKKGSRDYQRNDYVETISDHFDMHIRYLRKIAGGAPESFYVFHDTVAD